MKKFFSIIKEKLFTRVEKQHSEAYLRRISFLNKYSLLFHMLISCGIVFMVEVLSRRSFLSACSFVGMHTGAFFYKDRKSTRLNSSHPSSSRMPSSA